MTGRWALRIATLLGFAFLYIPIGVIVLYAFNAQRVQAWPIQSFSTEWFSAALDNESVRGALLLSLEVGAGATLVALVLGSLAAFAVQRYRFFGRETVSFALVLPIALPGIVTGMALNSSINATGIGFTTLTIIIGHATFCIVVVYNNVIARLRRSSRTIEEASMDLGADAWQTFRHVTLPVIRSALIAGGLLAFALSFDEIIVTTFTAGTEQTLPIWILSNLARPNQRPIVNVVAVALIVLSAAPVYLASRLSGSTGVGGSRT
ncbi:MAG TPA: ABC transporter permease [Candidatus Limnocylindrales bacterium]|nr:ABC transporter permease [Candidatus Limnocylindrales bacterium]